jgi:hypothetical protein
VANTDAWPRAAHHGRHIRGAAPEGGRTTARCRSMSCLMHRSASVCAVATQQWRRACGLPALLCCSLWGSGAATCLHECLPVMHRALLQGTRHAQLSSAANILHRNHAHLRVRQSYSLMLLCAAPLEPDRGAAWCRGDSLGHPPPDCADPPPGVPAENCSGWVDVKVPTPAVRCLTGVASPYCSRSCQLLLLAELLLCMCLWWLCDSRHAVAV